MELTPVIDVLEGIVVRAIAGQRSEYRPLTSVLTGSYQPLDVARAFRDNFGLTRLYLADLDAILHGRPNWNLYEQLLNEQFEAMIDAGVCTVEQSLRIRRLGAASIVGLESCPDPQRLFEIAQANDNQIVFSLDLKAGKPLMARDATGWRTDPWEIAHQAVTSGINRMIVLDLADVGTFGGGRTDGLCRALHQEFPSLSLIVGGGVRNLGDLKRIQQNGAASVLVASALHDGRLTHSDVAVLAGESKSQQYAD